VPTAVQGWYQSQAWTSIITLDIQSQTEIEHDWKEAESLKVGDWIVKPLVWI
jgi:hypothetical protein